MYQEDSKMDLNGSFHSILEDDEFAEASIEGEKLDPLAPIKAGVKRQVVKHDAIKLGSKFKMPRSSMNAGVHQSISLVDLLKLPEKQKKQLNILKQKEDQGDKMEAT
jgi:hypothetical protein